MTIEFEINTTKQTIAIIFFFTYIISMIMINIYSCVKKTHGFLKLFLHGKKTHCFLTENRKAERKRDYTLKLCDMRKKSRHEVKAFLKDVYWNWICKEHFEKQNCELVIFNTLLLISLKYSRTDMTLHRTTVTHS